MRRLSWRHAVAAVPLVAVLVLALSGIATGDHRDGQFIKVDDTTAAKFDGTVNRDSHTGPSSVPECAATNCDHITMKVALPNTTWNNPGGVQVTITWDHREHLFNDIALLAVYKQGVRVGVSDAFVTTFQSTRLNTSLSPTSTPNGVYDIYVAYAGYTTDFGLPPSEKIHYKGWAQVQYEVPVQPVRDLLPELRPLMPEVASFNHPPAIFGDLPALDTIGCFTSERDEQGAQKCLRIEQKMWNQNGRNRGPLEIRFAKPTNEMPAVLPAEQRVYRSDGTFYDRPAGTVDLHPTHSHYHYSKYTQSHLYAIGPDGRPVGSPLASGIKNGFCLADTDVIAGPNQQFVDPMVYTAPNCLEPRSTSPDGLTQFFVEGEGPGNGDTYDWDLPDQMIEVSGVSDGTYLVQTIIDPDHKVLEANPTNNCIAVRVRLSGMNTATPTVQILGAGPTCRS